MKVFPLFLWIFIEKYIEMTHTRWIYIEKYKCFKMIEKIRILKLSVIIFLGDRIREDI